MSRDLFVLALFAVCLAALLFVITLHLRDLVDRLTRLGDVNQRILSLLRRRGEHP